jgi:translation initiation factor 1A
MGKTGGKNQKNKKKISKNHENEKGELVFKEIGQEYAQILKMLGNGRCETYCFDGVKRLCHIRGKMKKKIWINIGDIVLIGIRDFQDQKGDIILKYSSGEARSLKAYGELPTNIEINSNDNVEQEKLKSSLFDEGFDFENHENLNSD